MVRSASTFMRSFYFALLMLCIGVSGVYAEQPEQKADPQEKAAAPTTRKGLQQRIDFGNAQILGQSIKSGAVYLMHRKKSDIKNMLEVRKNYREEIKEDFGLENTAIDKSATEQENAPKQ